MYVFSTDCTYVRTRPHTGRTFLPLSLFITSPARSPSACQRTDEWGVAQSWCIFWRAHSAASDPHRACPLRAPGRSFRRRLSRCMIEGEQAGRACTAARAQKQWQVRATARVHSTLALWTLTTDWHDRLARQTCCVQTTSVVSLSFCPHPYRALRAAPIRHQIHACTSNHSRYPYTYTHTLYSTRRRANSGLLFTAEARACLPIQSITCPGPCSGSLTSVPGYALVVRR